MPWLLFNRSSNAIQNAYIVIHEHYSSSVHRLTSNAFGLLNSLFVISAALLKRGTPI